MDLLKELVNAFKFSLPPSLAVYGGEILLGLALLQTVLILVLGWLAFRTVRGRTVCLLGLSESGKTLLFLQLKFGTFGETQNSISENIQQYKPLDIKNSKPITLVDIPGNERVRERTFSKFKEGLRGVVLVIDSLNFSSQVHDVAELLYDLLSDPIYNRTKSPLLVACNKQDMAPLASPKESIRTALEKEITQLQVSRQAKPKALDGGPKALKPVEFVKKGKDFSFTDLPSWCSVSFVECSARGKGDEGKAKIKEVQEWIDGLCY